jgi:hypothetical protein
MAATIRDLAELIRACSAGHSESWGVLWPWIESVTRPPILRLLRNRRLDLTLADDLGQDFFFHLGSRNAYRLRRFRGSGLPEFRGFIVPTGHRFAIRWLSPRRHGRASEQAALRSLPRAPWAGPSEAEYHAALADLGAFLADGDRERLQAPWDVGVGRATGQETDEVSARTQRRRTERLYVRCAARMGGLPPDGFRKKRADRGFSLTARPPV